MRDETVLPGIGPGSRPAGPGSCRLGRPRPQRWGHVRVVLLLGLGAAIGLPWLPALDVPPDDLPMRRVHGGSGASVCRFALGPDGRTIATVDVRGRVRLQPVVEGRGLARELDVRGSTAPAFAPDGRHLAVGRVEPDIILCELQQGGRERRLGVPVEDVNDLCFAPDGRTLAIASARSGEILLWDVEAGRPRGTLPGHRTAATPLAFAPDGRSLASAGVFDSTVVIWDLESGRPRHRLGAASVCCLAYSPDGRILATANGWECRIQLWDTRTGGPPRPIAVRDVAICSAAFSPDGRLLATAADDGTASLWALATGRELRRLDGRADRLWRVAFSPDGRTLAAIGNDGDVRCWDLDGLRAAE